MSVVRDHVEKLMRSNLRQGPNGPYTVPSQQSYPYQWFWDSCFAAIVWSHIDPTQAQAELRTLLSAQHQDGFCGHIAYWEKGPIIDIDWGLELTSSLLQPPLIAYATLRVYETNHDTNFLKALLPALESYYDFVLRTRNVRHQDLYGYINSDESGEDNSPRFDIAMTLPPKHSVETHLRQRIELFSTHTNCSFNARCTAQQFWVEDVGFNTYLVWNLECVARICDELDLTHEAVTWRNHSKRIANAMRTEMFHSDRFQTLTGLTGDPVTTKTWIDFLPLLTQQYTKAEAAALVQELFDPKHYWLPHGIPTVAKSEESYDPFEPSWGEAWQHPHWRGPSWHNVHWFLYHGLRQYGYDNEADQIKAKTIALIETEGFREYYHPETGVGQGAETFTWGGLVLDME